MSRKPTEQAEASFRYAERASMAALNGVKAKGDEMSVATYNIGTSLVHMARGMTNLAIGLRATYLLLEDVNRKLDAQALKPR